MVDDITKAMNRLDETVKEEVLGSYADYQAATFEHCKSISKHAQEMVLKTSTSPNEISDSSRELTTTYEKLVESTCCAMATLESHEINRRLKIHGSDLGTACKDLIQSGANVQGNPNDIHSKKDLADCARVVTEKVRIVGMQERGEMREREGGSKLKGEATKQQSETVEGLRCLV